MQNSASGGTSGGNTNGSKQSPEDACCGHGRGDTTRCANQPLAGGPAAGDPPSRGAGATADVYFDVEEVCGCKEHGSRPSARGTRYTLATHRSTTTTVSSCENNTTAIIWDSRVLTLLGHPPARTSFDVMQKRPCLPCSVICQLRRSTPPQLRRWSTFAGQGTTKRGGMGRWRALLASPIEGCIHAPMTIPRLCPTTDCALCWRHAKCAPHASAQTPNLRVTCCTVTATSHSRSPQ